MILLLLACHTPTWTDEGALAPHRARLDRDHDGRVTQGEYDRAAWNGPPFASADADADSDLSSAELLRLVRAQSATAFDQPGADPPLQRATAAFTPAPVAMKVNATYANTAKQMTMTATALQNMILCRWMPIPKSIRMIRTPFSA